MTKQIKRCPICLLPETFPGIKFNNQGVCNLCQNFESTKNLEEKKLKYRNRFKKLIKEYKNVGTYDALVAYSGGKDSTYTLYIIKEKYALNPLAMTFDNGFLTEQTFTNIRNMTDKLNIDHIFLKPRYDMLQTIFQTCSKKNIFSHSTIRRASTICTACIAITKFSALRTALEKNIPFLVYGYSPGQIPLTSSIFKNNPKILEIMQKNLYEPLYNVVGNQIKPFFLEDKHFRGSNSFPFNIAPFAFLDYNEQTIYKKLAHLGWKAPEHVDANTTNCLLNSYANMIHKKKYNFHPYAFELSKLVREGQLERSIALERLNSKENPQIIERVKNRLNYDL